MKNGDYCFMHSPEHADEAAEARRVGGLRRRREATVASVYDLEHLGALPLVQRLAWITLADTLSLENSLGRTRALISLSYLLLRLNEAVEFRERIAEFEVVLKRRPGNG